MVKPCGKGLPAFRYIFLFRFSPKKYFLSNRG